MPAVAVAGAGLAVTAGVSSAQSPAASPDTGSAQLLSDLTASATVSAEERAELTAERGARTSRSDRRTGAERTKDTDRRTGVDRTKDKPRDAEKDAEQRSDPQSPATKDVVSGEPREIAQAMLPQFGFSSDQFSCLDALWTKESGWNVHADNPTSSAYGIPQALPGSKMASAGEDWAGNPATQIRWGLGYIAGRYGSPCAAWGHSQSHNWY